VGRPVIRCGEFLGQVVLEMVHETTHMGHRCILCSQHTVSSLPPSSSLRFRLMLGVFKDKLEGFSQESEWMNSRSSNWAQWKEQEVRRESIMFWLCKAC